MCLASARLRVRVPHGPSLPRPEKSKYRYSLAVYIVGGVQLSPSMPRPWCGHFRLRLGVQLGLYLLDDLVPGGAALHPAIYRAWVLALNMPAGANPALGRAIGVLLKNAMQALLRRPAGPDATSGPQSSSATSTSPINYMS